jgi:hypothetical protein
MRDGKRGNEKGQGGLVVISALAGLVIAGCATAASYPPPTSAQLAAAESNVKSARDSGAGNDTKAAPLLRAAEEELSTAKDLAASGDNRGATLLLARAEADAELGHMLARRARANSEAALVERQLEETRRSQPRAAASAPGAATATPTPTPTPTPSGVLPPPASPVSPAAPATATAPATLPAPATTTTP